MLILPSVRPVTTNRLENWFERDRNRQMNKRHWSLDLKRPFVQLAWLLLLALMLHLLLLVWYGHEVNSRASHWVVSGSVLMMYAFFCAAGLLRVDEVGPYVRDALYAYMILLILMYGAARAFSVAGAYSLMSVQWIFFVITFAFFVFLAIVVLMRKIIAYAQRQDTETK